MDVLRLRSHSVCLSLMVIILAATFPQVAFPSIQCAASAKCVMMHCSCCGPNCPMAAHSHAPQKRGTVCDQQCPFLAQSQPVLISNPQSLTAAILTVCRLEPAPFSCVFPPSPAVPPSRGSPPATLLSLACALTI
jgi:hypothetical protein